MDFKKKRIVREAILYRPFFYAAGLFRMVTHEQR